MSASNNVQGSAASVRSRPFFSAAVLVLVLLVLILLVLILLVALILVLLILLVIHDNILRKDVLRFDRSVILPQKSGFILGFE